MLVVIAARFPARGMADPDWAGCAITAPRTVDYARRWRDLLTGQTIEWCAGEALPVQVLNFGFPFVILMPDSI